MEKWPSSTIGVYGPDGETKYGANKCDGRDNEGFLEFLRRDQNLMIVARFSF